MPRAKGDGAAKRTKSVHSTDPLPEGVVLNDLIKGRWKTGKPIGSGGFGTLYLAARESDEDPHEDTAKFVVKVEPKSNGPLFTELSVYHRVAKESEIQKFKDSKKLKSLGMPRFVASGFYSNGRADYRYMVMDRFGPDLDKLFVQNGRRFPDKTIFTLGLQMLDVLEYMHSKQYVHADIKASNMLIGLEKSNFNQAYLVDFGLACKYTLDGCHREYKEDPKRCHDGTVEFTSIDAHKGVGPSRRGDLEILGYCMLQWLSGKLPWEDNLMNKEYVKNQKIRYQKDIKGLMRHCNVSSYKDFEKFLQYVANLDYKEEPNYKQCKKFFKDSLKALGVNNDGKLTFINKSKSDPGLNTSQNACQNKRLVNSPLRLQSPKRNPRKKAVKATKRMSVEMTSSSDSEESYQPRRKRRTPVLQGGSSKHKSDCPSAVPTSPRLPAKARATAGKSKYADNLNTETDVAPRRGRKSPAAAATSPRVTSPRVTSPRVTSPRVTSPLSNPRVNGLRVTSPRLKSPVGKKKDAAATKLKKKPGRAKASIGVQTSPHLRGLKYRKK